ncbi:MAG: Asp-tRNA(Asn)/Glu-tRNA(Gln) amidotransferase subunit GatB [Candidatus Pacearchaeota archaeon]|nr:Asp-tRNA(Asn)/Glu-tRNA(Gln) amidotransferase subunit GatB [Candidatus Pacearchaeota archaeon]
MVNEIKGMIGLEIHCYLLTKEKLFCRCKASRERGLKPNIYVCPICTGMPGAKPMAPNFEAIKKAIAIALMLGCKINNSLRWQRKHYDWPDLPKGYQNTISGAESVALGENGNLGGIRIKSMHLEEDPASWNPDNGCVDYNRSGLPLVEIITEPDFSSAEEVVNWLKILVHNLSYLKAVDSNAGIKADVNVNIPKKTERVEIKNINSIENIGKAIEYELKRQMLEGGKTRETRRFDEAKGKTEKMREKESAEDYRFINEPDLQEIIIEKKKIGEVKKEIPEMPEEKLKKLIKKHKIDKKNAEILTKNIDIVEFFERVAEKIDGKFALPWVTIELLRFLNYNKKTLNEVNLKVEHFVNLLKLVKDGKITELKAKEILNRFYPNSFDPNDVVKHESKITDEVEITKIAEEVLKENEGAVKDYKKGEKKAFDFLMGMIMAKTKKRADYFVSRKVLERLLKY